MAEENLTPAQQRQRKLVADAKRVLEQSGNDITRLSEEQRRALELEYGYAYALISTNASLRRIFTNAVRTGMTPEAFELAVRNSDWAKRRDASLRKFEMAQSFVDNKGQATNATGADHLRRINDVAAEVKRQAVTAAGVTVTDEQARETALKILRGNYDDWQTVVGRVVRTDYVKNNALEFGGEAATQEMNIRSYARQMGISLSDEEIGRYVDGIFDQTNTFDNIAAKLRSDSAKMFPQFADRIAAGATLDEISFPYRRTMASLLEIDEDQIDLISDKNGNMDPLLQRAMYSVNEKGQPSPMSLTDFRMAVRKDDRWQYTKNARDEASRMTRDILRMFGAGI